MAKAVDKREARMGSAMARAESSGFDRPALNIPEGIALWTPKPGGYTVDIVPYIVGPEIKTFAAKNFASAGDIYFERTYYAHRNVGPNKDLHLCLAKNFNKPCPPCEYRNGLSQDPKFKKERDALWPTERQLFYVRVKEEAAKGIMLWEIAEYNFGRQLFSKIKNAREEMRAKYATFFNPAGGFSLRVVGEETPMGEGGKYTKFDVHEWIPRGAIPDKAWKGLPPLERIPSALAYPEYKKLFLMIEDNAVAGAAASGAAAEPAAAEPAAADEWGSTEAEPAAEVIEKGSSVTWEYKGATMVGTVSDINESKGLAKVAVEGQEKDSVVKLAELSLVTEEPEAEAATDDGGWGDAEAGTEAPAADDGGWGTADAAAEPAADDSGWGAADAGAADAGWDAPADPAEPKPATAKGRGRPGKKKP